MAVKMPSLETSQRPIPQPASGVVSVRGPTGAETAEGEALMRLGTQVQGVGSEAYAAFKVEEEKTNTLRAEDAYSKLRSRQLDLTYGAENGFMNLKGSAAVDRPLGKEWGERFNQAYKTIESELGNDDQKQKFRQRATIARLQYDEGILKHLASENDTLAKQTTVNGIKSEVAIVAAQPLSEGAMATSMERVNSLIDKDVERQGLRGKAATEAADVAKRNVRDAMWNARIEALLYSQPMMAEQLFRANEKEISNPELRLQLQAKTREAGTAITASIEAQRVVDEVRAKMTAPDQNEAVLTPVSTGGPVPYRFRTPAGNLVEGEAPTEEEAYRRVEKGSGQRVQRVSAEDRALAPDTNGLPHSRDIAAQLPFMLQRVEKRADELYGKDHGNPDRAAFIKRMTSEIQSRVAADVQQLTALQKQAQGILIDAIAGQGALGAGGTMKVGGRPTPVTAFSQIQANPEWMRAWQMLDSGVKPAMLNLIQKNMEIDKPGDEVLYRSLWNRIHLEPGDPQKIEFYKQITDPAVADKLSIDQIGKLRLEIDRQETPGGRSAGQMRKNADSQVSQYFKTNIMFTAQPERQIAATMRWNEEVGKKVDALITQGKPELVRNLFMLDDPQSVVNPKYLQTFVNSTPAQGVREQSAAVKAAAEAGKPIPAIKTDADYDALPPGTIFIDPKGEHRQKPGKAQQAPAAAVPTGAPPNLQPVQMTETGKLVLPKAKGDIPKFSQPRGYMDPEERAMHQGALWEAIKSVPKAVGGLALEAGVAPMILAGDFMRWVSELPEKNQAAGAKGAFHFLLEQDTFSVDDVPIVQAALKYGKLGYDDKKKAKAMLDAAGVK